MSEKKSYLDSFAQRQELESFQEEKFVQVTNKSKWQRVAAGVVIAAVVIAAAILLYSLLGFARVPALTGLTLEEANIWATKNRIILASKSVYSFTVNAGVVTSQEIAAGRQLRKNSVLGIEVSLGADPEEKISWPDIGSMTLAAIEQWISDNKLTGVKIVTASSDVVAADQVISYTLTDQSEENFQRKSRATINVSTGPAKESETVVVSDFSAMKAAAILQWGRENGVSIELSEAFDTYIASGSVISQSVKAGTEIVKRDPIGVVISLGQAITVPDFSALLPEEASAWAKENAVSLISQQKYSGTATKGSLLSQSVPPGAIIQAGSQIKLEYSLGRVELASFIGRTKLDMLNWQSEVNAKDGNISLSFSEAYGEKGSAGKIISQSIKNDTVLPGTKITAVISLGMRLLAPDFSGMHENECRSAAQALGLTVLFNYQNSSTVPKGEVIKQSPVAGSVMSDAIPLTVTLSLTTLASNLVSVPDFSSMSREVATAWGKTNNISLSFADSYQDDYPEGNLFEQSIAAGTAVTAGSGITIGYSLGQVKMISLIGKTRLDLYNWLNGVNAQGAGITALFTVADNHTYAMNVIIDQSIMNTYIETGTAVTFTISWEPAAP